MWLLVWPCLVLVWVDFSSFYIALNMPGSRYLSSAKDTPCQNRDGILTKSTIVIKLVSRVISSYKVPVPPTIHTNTHTYTHMLMFEIRKTLKREETRKEIHPALLFPFLLVWSSLLFGLLYISLDVSICLSQQLFCY